MSLTVETGLPVFFITRIENEIRNNGWRDIDITHYCSVFIVISGLFLGNIKCLELVLNFSRIKYGSACKLGNGYWAISHFICIAKYILAE